MKTRKRVLVVEAAPMFRKAFVKALLRQRCRPSSTSEVFKLDNMICYQTTSQVKQAHEGVQVALVDALIDEKVKTGKPVTGVEVIEDFTKRGIECIGICCIPDHNTALRKAGAVLVLSKPVALAAIFAGVLPINNWPGMSQELAVQLDKFTASYRKNEKFKTKLDRFVASCQ